MVLNSLTVAWNDSVPHTLDRGHNSTTPRPLHGLQCVSMTKDCTHKRSFQIETREFMLN